MNDEVCPICIENHAEYYTECGHRYCVGCLSRIKTCAICRKSLIRSQLCDQIKRIHPSDKAHFGDAVTVYVTYSIFEPYT